MAGPENNWVNWHDYMPEKEANDYTFGSAATISKFAFLLAKQATIMEKLPVDLEGDRLSLARPLLMGISSNALAIVNLARNNFGNEIYPISRCLIERIITFYYLQYCDDEERINYIDYSNQKAYRKLNRAIKVNDDEFSIKYMGNIDLSEFTEMQKAVDKYTSKKQKKPITRWSVTPLKKMLSIIDNANEVKHAFRLMLISLETIYDDGSEALHGTLYGCTFHLGAFRPGKPIGSPEEMCDNHRNNLNMIMFLFGCLLSEINLYVANKCNFPEILDLAGSTYKQIKQTMESSA